MATSIMKYKYRGSMVQFDRCITVYIVKGKECQATECQIVVIK